MPRVPMREEITPMYRHVIGGVRPVMMGLTRRDWSGGENLPQQGGFVLASNHLSWADPLALAHFAVDHGRAPHFLAKASLFDLPVLRGVLNGTGQIPVLRGSGRAVDAFSAAVEAVEKGACVVVLPEGTITREPHLWPMSGKSGAARVALQTGCPLIPTAMWGPQEILWPYRGKVPKVLPRKTMQVVAGPPVDLSDLQAPYDARTLSAATERLMDAITGLLEGLRHEQAPAQRFDARTLRAADRREPS